MKRKLICLLTGTLLIVGITGCGSTNDVMTDAAVDTNISSNAESESQQERTVVEVVDTESIEVENITYEEAVYSLVVNDVTYEFPLTFDEFISYGWIPTNSSYTVEDIANVSIVADSVNQMLPQEDLVYVSNGDIKGAVLRVSNGDQQNAKLVKDCDVTGLDFSLRRDEEFKFFPVGSVQISGNNSVIKIGESTKEDVENMFGESLMMGDYITDEMCIAFEYDDNDVLKGIEYKIYN